VLSEDLFGVDQALMTLSLEHWPFEPEALSRLKPEWRLLVQSFLDSAQGQALERFLKTELGLSKRIYPPHPLKLLEHLGAAQAKVVILGQDPYHGLGQAEGLAFSVAKGVRCPPSLLNVFKELERDVKLPRPKGKDASLMPWVKKGVFLLNPVLTVEEGRAASHKGRGWEALTQAVLGQLLSAPGPRVFMLWGMPAQKLFDAWASAADLGLQDPSRHLILRANHPSPLSALRGETPFMGCGHFSKAQSWLKSQGVEMDWTLSG
jgi:uracil-DNA glycosylase